MSYLIAVVSGFASGIFVRSLFNFGWAPIAFALLLATLSLLAWWLRDRRAYLLLGLFFLLASLGMLRFAIADTPLPEAFRQDFRKQVKYEGVVVADPDIREKTQRVRVKVEKGGETTNVLVVAPHYPVVSVGDRVRVAGLLLTPQPFETDGGRTFRYDRYLERDGVRFIISFASIRLLEPAPWYSIPGAFAKAKHAFIDGLREGLPEPHASLASGITIGGESGIGTELHDAFIRSGLVHIIVLSGYNIMIVAEWLMKGLAAVRLRKRFAFVAAGAAVVLFVLVAGAEAPAVRAMLMALIALYARASGRTYAAGRALFFAAFLMLLWNPFTLAFDPGFGLSLTATAGLIWLAPRVEAKLLFIKYAFLRDVAATTIAAQVAVLPLLLYETGNLSLVALPANLLVLPMMPFAMGLSAIAGVAGMLLGNLFPPLVTLLSLPAYLANAYAILVAEHAAALPFAAVILPAFPFTLVLLAYALLIYAATTKRFSITPQLRFAKNASI
jgi:competence protein ComEC